MPGEPHERPNQSLPPSTFGQYLRLLRNRAELTVRDAALRIGIDPSYLSKLEHDVVSSPSPAVLERMARVYGKPLDEFARTAKRGGDVLSEKLRHDRKVQALFRYVADSVSPDQVFDAVREALTEVLRKVGKTDAQIEKAVSDELRRLEQEFRREPRASAGLFAAVVQPRRLSRLRLESMAEELLRSVSLDESQYAPPTPVERVISEHFADIDVIWHEPIEAKPGHLRVLGLARWGDTGREILINPVLADDCSSVAAARIAFTLAHELLHAIEHLPRIHGASAAGALARTPCHEHHVAGKEAICNRNRRRLQAPEDWAEFQANAYAAALLMPRFAVRRAFAEHFGVELVSVDAPAGSRVHASTCLEVADTDIGNGLRFHELFEVSRQAFAIRIEQLGLVRPLITQGTVKGA